jgi:hypothetical protein
MKSGLEKMLNQIRRIWADKGMGDKDFTNKEIQLRTALEHLRDAADSLSRASDMLLDVINEHVPAVVQSQHKSG